MSTDFRVEMGKRMALERERLGYARQQKPFALDLGLKPRTYQDWELGHSSPSGEYFHAALLKGVDIVFVLTGARGMDTTGLLSVEEEKLVSNYRASSPSAQSSLREVGAAFAQQGDPGGKASGE